jgi:hypothetical protein
MAMIDGKSCDTFAKLHELLLTVVRSLGSQYEVLRKILWRRQIQSGNCLITWRINRWLQGAVGKELVM